MKVFILRYKMSGLQSVFSSETYDLGQLMVTEAFQDEARHDANEISLDLASYKLKNGFDLSQFEVENFLLHRRAWKEIAKTGGDALIVEEFTQINAQVQALVDHMMTLPTDWDVFFPFDGQQRREKSDDAEKFVLPAWGSDVYFVSQKGANKLLSGNSICRPVDEEIIYRSRSELNLYYEQTDLFLLKKNPLLETSRGNSIREAIFGACSWSVNSRSQIRHLLKKMSETARCAGIELTLSFGTLLGYVRHGEIMPWDDDVDLSIDSKDLKKFLAYLNQDDEVKFGRYNYVRGNMVYYKFWLADGKPINGQLHTFPFVDLWLFNVVGDTVVYLENISEFPAELYFPLKSVHFEDSDFCIPHDSLGCLDENYNDWRDCIQVFTWSHREERRAFIPLRLRIRVDGTGRILEQSMSSNALERIQTLSNKSGDSGERGFFLTFDDKT